MRHTQTLCGHCGQPVTDTPLCRDSEQLLHALLRRLTSTRPAILRDATGHPLEGPHAYRPSTRWDTPLQEHGGLPRLIDEAIARQVRFTGTTKISRHPGPEARLPSRAGDHAPRLHAVVINAANTLIKGAICVQQLPMATETTTAAEWLLDGFSRLRLQPWAGELLTNLERAVEDAERMIDRPPERRYLGICGSPASEPCPGQVFAVGNATTGTCNRCRARHDVAARDQQRIEQLHGVRLTAAEIERVTGELGRRVLRNTITKWKERGRITCDGAGRYLVDDVLRLAEQTSRRRAG